MALESGVYDYYNVTVIAKSFVREQVRVVQNATLYMVVKIRRMMSCIVFRGYDRLEVARIKWLLNNPISSNFFDLRIPIAPPNGLFLTDVVYDPNMFTRPRPYYQHSWDYE